MDFVKLQDLIDVVSHPPCLSIVPSTLSAVPPICDYGTGTRTVKTPSEQTNSGPFSNVLNKLQGKRIQGAPTFYSSHFYINMADRRPDSDESGRSKRQKTSSTDMDPKANPYLAHMYEEDDEDEGVNTGSGYGYGYGKPAGKMNGRGVSSALARFPRHKTNAAMAKSAEDGPNNPFNGKPLSTEYFNILKTRRNLPVHAQR